MIFFIFLILDRMSVSSGITLVSVLREIIRV